VPTLYHPRPFINVYDNNSGPHFCIYIHNFADQIISRLVYPPANYQAAWLISRLEEASDW